MTGQPKVLKRLGVTILKVTFGTRRLHTFILNYELVFPTSKFFDQFLLDFEVDRDPTHDLSSAKNDLENGKIDPELLKIRLNLEKDRTEYAVNNPNKKIGIVIGAKAGDII